MAVMFGPAGSLVKWKLFLLLAACTLWRHCVSNCSSTRLQSSEGIKYFISCSVLNVSELKRSPASVLNNIQPSAVLHMVIYNVDGSDVAVEAGTFANFTELTVLQIYASGITSLQDGAFSGLDSLNQLILNNVKLSVLSMGPFRTLSGNQMSLDFRNDMNYPIAFNRDLEPFFREISQLTISVFAVCDCHFVWFKDFFNNTAHSVCDVTCSSSQTSIDGVCLDHVTRQSITSTCPEICTTALNDCGENSDCIASSNNNFTCVCHEGFEENSNSVCVDFNECVNNSDLCSQVERCVNTHGNYTCEPIVCPSLETVSNRTCVCVNDLVRNVTSGECVCPSGDLTYNTTEEACVCIDPLAVFNISLGSCVCDSTSTHSLSKRKCICSDPLAVLNDTLRRCVCDSTAVFSVSEDKCVCADPLAVFNSTTQTCVCVQSSVYSDLEGKCVCSDPLAVFNSTEGRCVCGNRSHESGGKCICSDPLAIFSTTEGRCVCVDGSHESGGRCICSDPLAVYNEFLGQCVCDSTSLYSRSDDKCVCADPLAVFNSTTQTCVCDQFSEYSDLKGKCVCSDPLAVFNTTEEACVCKANLIKSGDSCVCPTFMELSPAGDMCVCLPGREYNSSSNVCNCIPYAEETGDRDDCVCRSYLLRNLVENACVCIDKAVEMGENCSCVGNRVYNMDTGQCECHPLYEEDPTSRMCTINNDLSYEGVLDALNLEESQLSTILIEDAVEILTELIDEDLNSNNLTNLLTFITSSAVGLVGLEPNEDLYNATQAVVNLTSHLLADEVSSVWNELSEGEVVSRISEIFNSLDMIALALTNYANATGQGRASINTENIHIRVVIASSNSTEHWRMFSSNELSGSSGTASSIILPDSLVSPNDTGCAIISGAIKGINRIYRNIKATEENSTSKSSEASPTKLSGLCLADVPVEMEPKVNSVVITTTLTAGCSANTSYLPDAVNISLYHENSNLQNPVCVSDSIQGSDHSLWNSEGCMVIESNSTHTLCSCSHLTNFAVLLYPQPVTENFKALSIASKCGLSLSIICLLATVIILFVVKVKSELPKVHRQLALSLLLTEVVFLIGVDRQAVPSPDGLCTTFAALLHYLLLVTFAWMLIEGVHMFVKLVLVYYSKKIYIVYYFLAWGIPIIIVAVSLGANFCVYGSTAYCWISGPNSTGTLWGAVLAPILVVLLVNSVMLIIVTGIVIKAKRRDSTKNKNTTVVLASLRTAIILFPFLGLGWTLGFFIFGENLDYIQAIEWIFFVVVTLQGILIFVLNCLVNTEVRTALLKKLKRNKTRLPRPSSARRRSSTVSAAVSLKQTWRRMSTGSIKKSSDITELSLKDNDDRMYTVARPQVMLPPVISDIMEEDEVCSHHDSDVVVENVSPAEKQPGPGVGEDDVPSQNSQICLITNST